MKSAPHELKTLLKYPSFRAFHSTYEPTFSEDLQRFLASTMDEVRTSVSGRIAISVLETIGLGDFGLFREAVLRRELTGTIAYAKQRDHSSHTVYNYLLGWYFFRHCAPFRQALEYEFKKRGVGKRHASKPFTTHAEYFGCVWQYVSLLHDVGYMFEGGISTMDFEESKTQAAIGANTARIYFNRIAWIAYNLELPHQRSQLLCVLGDSIAPPPFDRTDSLADIADGLRFLGDLQVLSAPVRNALAEGGISSRRRPEFEKLSGDAFELWAHHYEHFGSSSMARRIGSLRNVFNGLIDKGLPGAGIRILDHGVCSGLLQLLASTYYYRLHGHAEMVASPEPIYVKRVLQYGWNPSFWWTGIVWATAAAAIHNVQQMKDVDQVDQDWPGQLNLRDDPLAYLGFLVDTLEEWDRYSVFKTLDREPIQGNEVSLGNKGGKVIVCFLGPLGTKRARVLRNDLDGALAGWKSLLDVRP
jgi:hypothetical protein